MKQFGIVVFDLSGGDAAYHFVDGERFLQIGELVRAAGDEERWQDRLNEHVGWLTCDGHDEVEKPTGAPERRGKLLKTYYTQTYTLELTAGIEGFCLGILTLP